MDPRGDGELSPMEQFIEESQKEYERVQQELREIEVLIQQSTGEVEKLTRRNAQITNRLRQVEATFDTVPREDIQEVYTAAQDAQKRLFIMRGQLEKLQSDQQHLQRYAELLRRVLELLSEVSVPQGRRRMLSGDGEEPTAVRIIEAQEHERQRLARQMHDGPAQSLTNLILQAEICERLFDKDPDRARVELANLKQAVTTTFQKVRDFIFDLRPMMLDDLGLVPTLKRYVASFQEKSGLPTNLAVTGKERRLEQHYEVTIFRVIQELLTNAWRHAHASNVQVTLDLGDELVRATVEDNGSGFDVNEVMAASAQQKTIGLATLRERVEMLGGEVHIDSSIGRGTKVTVEIPLG